MSDTITIDDVRYTITNRQTISYPLAESPEQRKARGDVAPTISYTVASIERVRESNDSINKS